MSNGIRDVFKGAAGRLNIPKGVKKHSCGVCKCSLALMLPTKLENLHEDTSEQKALRPLNCWVNPK